MAAAHYNYGLMLAKEGDHQNAADAFNRAIDILAVDPDSALAPLPHYCLGLIHAARGEYDDALQAYNRALEFSSDLPYVHNELGKVYKQRDQLEESEAAYKRALELKADLLGAHYDLMTHLDESGPAGNRGCLCSGATGHHHHEPRWRATPQWSPTGYASPRRRHPPC